MVTMIVNMDMENFEMNANGNEYLKCNKKIESGNIIPVLALPLCEKNVT